jgi:hypothetical protein
MDRAAYLALTPDERERIVAAFDPPPDVLPRLNRDIRHASRLIRAKCPGSCHGFSPVSRKDLSDADSL